MQAAVGFDFAVQMPGLPGDESVRIMSEALELVGEEDSPLRARVQASLALALALAGRMKEAKPVGDASLVAARRHGDPTVIMSALQCALIYEENSFVYTEIGRRGVRAGGGAQRPVGVLLCPRGRTCAV